MFDDRLLEKRKKLQELGVDPYPYDFQKTHNIDDILEQQMTLIDKKVSIAGRITGIRRHGKVYFADLEDITGKIQLYLKKNIITERNWQAFELLDIGDLIGLHGKVFITKMGELTLGVENFEVLSKTVVNIPIAKSKNRKTYYQLSDPEIKYRERYLDWITNKNSRVRMIMRSKIISEIRNFMQKRGFLEVTVPTIEMIYGGAEAKPFETSIRALGNQSAFLRISPELPLKRFIVGGFPKVFTICQNFRNEGIDRSHNPEFTMMEWYEAYTDYEYQLEQFEELVATVAKKICGTTKVEYQGNVIDFSTPWKRISMLDAIREIGDFDAANASDTAIINWYREHNLEIIEPYNRGLAIAEMFDNLCEDKIIQPTFIIDHPKETSPLCKAKRGNPDLIERFEPYVAGMEIGNAYSELTDPVVQFEKFEEQRQLREKDEIEHHPMDMDFIKAVGCGMPPAGGVGFGIDRIIMLLTNSPSIRDIIAFPMMKPK